MALPNGVPLTNNLLLAAIGDDALRAMEPQLRYEEVAVSQRVFDRHVENDVVFPIDGVVSLLRELENGDALEIGMIGAEGMAGVNAVLGVAQNPHHGIAQARGVIARISREAMQRCLETQPRIRDVVHRYVFSYISYTAQLAVCNRMHLVEQRLAHWLLLLHDRVVQDEMSLTQEFLAYMLGTRRAGINEAVGRLHDSGAIQHRRNRVLVTDRAKLEAAACECYRQNLADYEMALGFAPRVHTRNSPID
jgi:CRP-like cAMP-binding protein